MDTVLQPGTYRGSADGLTFEFRLECPPGSAVPVVSGDITRDGVFVSSLICTAPQVSATGDLEGPVAFRGNPGLFTGRLRLHSDARGIGTFQVAVDVQGGFRDETVGRMDWQGSYLRRVVIEVDGIDGTEPPPEITGAGGRVVSIARAFEDAGCDVTVNVDPFRGRGSGNVRGFTPAEIHRAMQDVRGNPPPADRLHVHLFVCGYLAGDPNVLGIMYDFGEDDLNRRPREGVSIFYDHPMLSDPRVPRDERLREYVFTAVHEIGHALNLLHSFDKSRPASLSWMNYPHLFPFGQEAPQGHDGTVEFWRRFPESFDEEELHHLRHGTPREVAAGGFPFGTYEEGTSAPLGGSADPRRTSLGANPLRVIGDVELCVTPLKRQYALGEPVFLCIKARNVGTHVRLIPNALDPTEGYVRLTIRRPDGRVELYRPPMRLCKQAQMVAVPPGSDLTFDGAPLFLSAGGPVFTEPGTYLIRADLAGVDGSRVVASAPAPIRILVPDPALERFAEESWRWMDGLRAVYLRHPLATLRGWNETEEEARVAGLDRQAGNTTWSYLNYVAGLGWLTPFAARSGVEKEIDPERAARRFREVNPDDLPSGVATRKGEVEDGTLRTRAQLARIHARPQARLRTGVPPSGLFGRLGLERPADVASPLNPFERVVPRLRGTRAFADVVSWNIEHLHDRDRWKKIPAVAELIRSFRCDFWGLQEVDGLSLAELTNALNSVGRVRYAYDAVEGSGQQNGVLYRTDTTRVQRLPPPAGLFEGTLEVALSDGERVTRPVFAREPYLADVRVVQEGGTFDFRCAVVHLKSTDWKLRDEGDALRLAAADALARWIAADRLGSGERDYMVLGDMNAETALQGLHPFSAENGLSLLSVGMKERYDGQAVTRIASGRFLDHIVVTSDSEERLPGQDLGELLVVRSDTVLSDWTEEYSDHLPVAVRFVLREGDAERDEQ